MGAVTFWTCAGGENMNHAYEELKRETREYYGSDPYNGTITTTEGVINITAQAKQFTDNNLTDEKRLNEFLDKAWNGEVNKTIEKWENCGGIDFGNGIFGFVGWAAE